MSLLEDILLITLGIAIVCATIIFIKVHVYNDVQHKKRYSNWALPCLVAVTLDTFVV